MKLSQIVRSLNLTTSVKVQNATLSKRNKKRARCAHFSPPSSRNCCVLLVAVEKSLPDCIGPDKTLDARNAAACRLSSFGGQVFGDKLAQTALGHGMKRSHHLNQGDFSVTAFLGIICQV